MNSPAQSPAATAADESANLWNACGRRMGMGRGVVRTRDLFRCEDHVLSRFLSLSLFTRTRVAHILSGLVQLVQFGFSFD